MATTTTTTTTATRQQLVHAHRSPALVQQVPSLVMDGPKVVREKWTAQATVQVVQDPFPERRSSLSKRAERHGLHP